MQIPLLFSSSSSSNSSRHLQSDEKASPPPPPPFILPPPPPFLPPFWRLGFHRHPAAYEDARYEIRRGAGDEGAKARTRGAYFEGLDSHGAFRLVLPPCLSISYSLFSSWCAVLPSSHISLEKNRVGGNAGAVTAGHEREMVFFYLHSPSLFGWNFSIVSTANE